MTTTPEPVYERERKFIVEDKSILQGVAWELIEQGYVWATNGYAIRARVILEPTREGGEHSFVERQARITAKGPNYGDEREEYEMDVHVTFAREIIKLSDNVIRKRRYHFTDPTTREMWEVDEFLDENTGLFIAELEGAKGSPNDDMDAIRRAATPKWAYKEVTGHPEFNNENLAAHPVSRWENEGDWKPESPWDWD